MDAVFHHLNWYFFGSYQTLKITAMAVSLGIIFGLFAGMGRLSSSRAISFVSTCYIDFFRGTPLLVQLFLVYFGLPQVIGEVQTFLFSNFGIGHAVTTTAIPLLVAGVAACSLNSGAYIGEIFRSGIQSIEKGQREAALSLGMTPRQAMRYVILPQAFRRVIPPLGNEFIAMLKDTSLLVTIGCVELMREGQLIYSDYFNPFPAFLTVAFFYLIMTLTLSRLVDYLERRLGVRGHHQS